MSQGKIEALLIVAYVVAATIITIKSKEPALGILAPLALGIIGLLALELGQHLWDVW